MTTDDRRARVATSEIFPLPPRGSVIKRLVACTAAAAVLWLAGVWLQSHVGTWSLPLNVAAVALALVAFHALLELLLRGPKVEIHRDGLALGRRFVPWRCIEKVEVEREEVVRKVAGTSHRKTTFTFHLRSGTRRRLALDDEHRPVAPDLPRFLHVLAGREIQVIDLNAPTVRRDYVTPGEDSFDPERARTVRRRFVEILDAADDGVGDAVLEAVQRGDRSRRALRLRLYLATGAAYLGAGLLLLLIVVTVFGISLSIAVLGTDDAGPVGWLVLAAAIPLVFWAMVRANGLAEQLAKTATRWKARAGALGNSGLSRDLDLHRPFVLYLRSFAGEHFQFLETPVSDFLPRYEAEDRDFDRRLLAAAGHNVPMVGLANPRDASPPGGLHRLFVSPGDWVQVAAALMQRATAVVLYLPVSTGGVMTELWALDHLDARDRTLLILGEDFAVDDLAPEHRKLVRGFPHRVTPTSPRLAAELRGVLATTGPG